MRNWLVVLVWMLLIATAHGQPHANYTSQARYEISKGRYANGIQLLNKSIGQNKFNSEAFFLRGIAKYELEDFIGAEKDFGQSLTLNPKNNEAFLYRGVCRSQQLNYLGAYEDFNQSIKLNDEDWRVYANRAMASLQLDRFVDVIADCNKVINLKNETAHTYLLRGEAKAGLGMYNVAIDDFERAMSLDTNAMRPVLHRGIARARLEQFENAITDFERALTLDSENMLPVFHRAAAYTEMGKYNLALTDLNKVLSQYPNNAIVLFNRAIIWAETNNPAKALADYERVVQLNPKNILGFYNRGNLYYNQKNYRAALADFNQAIALFPEFIDAHENRAEVLRLLGREHDFEVALRELQKLKEMLALSDQEVKYEQHIKLMKLTQLKGDFEPLQQEVGKVQHRQVDIQLLPFYRISAFPETEKNIAVYDGFYKPNYNMGVMAFVTEKEQQADQAKQLLESLARQAASGPAQHIKLASLYALLDNYPEAYNQLNKCIDADDSQAACYFSRASLLQTELQQYQEAFDAFAGSLDVVDSVYLARTQDLLTQAEMDYRKVLELDNEMSFAHFNLGHLLVSAERFEEAETQFGLAAAADGNFIEANYNRGLIRILLGKISKGCEDLSLAGELGMIDSYSIIKRYCD